MKKDHNNKCLYYMKKVFFHIYIQQLILTYSVFMLFSSDIENLFFREYDKIFSSIRAVILFLSIVEFCMCNAFEKNYTFSIFFFIDFVDLISLITEVSFIFDYFLEFLDDNGK